MGVQNSEFIDGWVSRISSFEFCELWTPKMLPGRIGPGAKSAVASIDGCPESCRIMKILAGSAEKVLDVAAGNDTAAVAAARWFAEVDSID